MKAYEYYTYLERKYDGPMPKELKKKYRQMLLDEANNKIANRKLGSWKDFLAEKREWLKNI